MSVLLVATSATGMAPWLESTMGDGRGLLTGIKVAPDRTLLP